MSVERTADQMTAHWHWNSPWSGEDPVRGCLDASFSVVYALGQQRLAVEVRRLTVSTPEGFSGSFEVHGNSLIANAARLAGEIRAAATDAGMSGLLAVVDCAGYHLAADGTEHKEPRLLRLRAEVTDGKLAVALAAHGDMWLPWDLAGSPQPAVHAANAPRLAAALNGISIALRTSVQPGAPTAFAVPTAGGAVNRLSPQGEPLDLRDPLNRLTADTPLYVPAHPRDEQVVIELLEGPEGAVPVAFTSLETLVERLGSAQPWAAVRAEPFLTLMDRLGATPVRIDPPVSPKARRWSTADLTAYAGELTSG